MRDFRAKITDGGKGFQAQASGFPLFSNYL